MNKLRVRDLPADPEQPVRHSQAKEVRFQGDSEQLAALRQLRNASSESFVRGVFFGFLAFLMLLGALSLQATTPAATEFDGVPPHTNEVSDR